MHHWTDLAESFLKMYGFAMLRTAGQNLYQVYYCVHYFVLFIIYVSTGTGTYTYMYGPSSHFCCRACARMPDLVSEVDSDRRAARASRPWPLPLACPGSGARKYIMPN